MGRIWIDGSCDRVRRRGPTTNVPTYVQSDPVKPGRLDLLKSCFCMTTSSLSVFDREQRRARPFDDRCPAVFGPKKVTKGFTKADGWTDTCDTCEG